MKFTYTQLTAEFVATKSFDTTITTKQLITFLEPQVRRKISPKKASVCLDDCKDCIPIVVSGRKRRQWKRVT